MGDFGAALLLCFPIVAAAVGVVARALAGAGGVGGCAGVRSFPAVSSAPIAVNPPMALLWGFTLLSYIATFFLVRELGWRFVDRPWVTVVPLLVIGFMEAVFGMIQVSAGWPNAEGSGTYTNRDHFSGMLEMFLPLAVMFGWAILQRLRENFEQSMLAGDSGLGGVGHGGAVPGCDCVFAVAHGLFCGVCSLFVTGALCFGPQMPSKNFRTVSLTRLAVGALALFVFLPARSIDCALCGDVGVG